MSFLKKSAFSTQIAAGSPCGATESAGKDAPLDLQRIRVLIVDDNLFARRLMRLALNALNMRQIAEAGNAADGIAAIGTFVPDLIFVDWEMDPLDGIAFLREVRRNDGAGARCVPIIVVSGYSEQWRILTARDAGASEYIVKPFTAKTVYRKIRALLDNPRPFIDVPEDYFGPDRRRREIAVEKERRAVSA